MSELLSLVNPECPGCVALLAKLEELTARVEELERKLGQNSNNSHQPPSSDPPSVREQRPSTRKKSGKKRGGQKGHTGSRRELLPAEKVDETHTLMPSTCKGCGHALCGQDETPLRHQITELPEIVPTVTEYQLHALSCPCCGEVTRATLSPDVPNSAFGPRLMALVATLTAHYRLSKDKARELLADVLGITISKGALSTLEAHASDALAESVEKLKPYIEQQSALGIDETRWSESGETAWLWVVVSELAAFFVIRGSRSGAVARELLGEEKRTGVVTTDRFSGYTWLERLVRQLCWAHLIRDFRKMANVRDETASAIGQGLQDVADRLFAYWNRLSDGELKRSSFRTYASGLRKELRALLERGMALEHKLVSGMCNAMAKVEASMWTFVRIEGIEPTNNESEREGRHGVIYRKLSNGTQSARGSRFVERMLTVRGTLRRQGRNVFQFLVDAMTAKLRGIPPPSLLPTSIPAT